MAFGVLSRRSESQQKPVGHSSAAWHAKNEAYICTLAYHTGAKNRTILINVGGKKMSLIVIDSCATNNSERTGLLTCGLACHSKDTCASQSHGESCNFLILVCLNSIHVLYIVL